MSAIQLAAWRQRQSIEGSALGKITVTNLDALVQQGIIDEVFATKAKEYLANASRTIRPPAAPTSGFRHLSPSAGHGHARRLHLHVIDPIPRLTPTITEVIMVVKNPG